MEIVIDIYMEAPYKYEAIGAIINEYTPSSILV